MQVKDFQTSASYTATVRTARCGPSIMKVRMLHATPPHRPSLPAASAGAADCAPVRFDAALLRKLNRSGPRYTSYPTADRFSARFGYGDYLAAVAARRGRSALQPL